jgi:biopolymer transport protein ExbB/TolQ
VAWTLTLLQIVVNYNYFKQILSYAKQQIKKCWRRDSGEAPAEESLSNLTEAVEQEEHQKEELQKEKEPSKGSAERKEGRESEAQSVMTGRIRRNNVGSYLQLKPVSTVDDVHLDINL